MLTNISASGLTLHLNPPFSSEILSTFTLVNLVSSASPFPLLPVELPPT